MATKPDDFEAAFAQFSAPEDKQPAAAATDTGAAPAAADDKGGQGDATGSGDAGAAAASGEPAGAADGGGGDGGAGGDQGAQGAEAGSAAASGGETPPAAADAAAGSPPPAGDAPAAQPAPASDAGSAAEDVLAKLSKLVADAKPTEAPAPAAPAAEEKPVYTQEETEQLKKYAEEWPEVAKFEAMQRGKEYQQLLGFVFGEVQKYVQPLIDQLDALAGRTHLSDVKSAVPDYSDNLREQVVGWVAKQPAYLQAAYNHVIQNGTVDEVKDLVDRYRQATGQAAPAAGAAPTGGQAQGKPGDNELSEEAKKAAAALAPVESKRSEVINSGDPSTFEDAWSQFAKDAA